MSDRTRLYAAYAMLVGAAALWGSNHVVARGLHETVPLISLSFWRWAGALILIFPLAWKPLQRDLPVILREWRMLTALAFVGIFVFTYTIYLAAYGTAAINVGLINATTPIWVLMIGAVFLSSHPTGLQWIGVVISLFGMVVIVVKGDMEALLGLQFGVGDLWALAAAVVWAVYTVMLKKAPKGVNPYSTLIAIIGIGAVMHLPVFLYDQIILGAPIFTHADPGHLDTVKIAYVAFGPAFLGYVFWNRGVAVVGPAVAGAFLYLIPVASALLAITFLGENLYQFHLIGIALIAFGIYLTSRRSGAG